MNSKDLIKLLETRNLIIKKVEHKPLMNMEEAMIINKEGDVAKNILLVDENNNYHLISIKGDKRVSLKTISLELGVKKVSFAKEEDMKRILKIDTGSLTPLALLNDKKHKVLMHLDNKFKNKKIGVHPLVNTCTVWMKSEDLIDILKENEVSVSYISAEKIL